MNYTQRNASSDYTEKDLARGYTGAVTTSVAIGVYGRILGDKTFRKLSGAKLVFANAILNYVARAFGNIANITLMRYKELSEGVKVENKEGTKTYGTSFTAGKQAVGLTALTRIVLPFPIMFLPVVGNWFLLRTKLMPKNVKLQMFTEMMLCGAGLALALPLAIACFEQRAMIERPDIDDHL